MKFQWYIINCEDGTVEGTNDVEQCEEFIENSDYVILTAQHGTYFNGDRSAVDVEELSSDEEEPDDGGD